VVAEVAAGAVMVAEAVAVAAVADAVAVDAVGTAAVDATGATGIATDKKKRSAFPLLWGAAVLMFRTWSAALFRKRRHFGWTAGLLAALLLPRAHAQQLQCAPLPQAQ